MNRDVFIDYLRTLGLILLIGVHVYAPEWYISFRTFDVPLMAFVSALCYKPHNNNYLTYVFKRFKRLYIPVFVFLTVFIIPYILIQTYINDESIKLSNILGSFILLNHPSIGYVWIIRVFLMIAILLPLIERIVRLAPSSLVIILILINIVAQHYLIILVKSLDDFYIRYIFQESILYIRD